MTKKEDLKFYDPQIDVKKRQSLKDYNFFQIQVFPYLQRLR